MTKHEQILSAIPISLGEPIDIEASAKNEAVRIYSIGGDKEHGIWLRVGNDTWHKLDQNYWHKLEESDQNYDMIADAILNRLNVQS